MKKLIGIRFVAALCLLAATVVTAHNMETTSSTDNPGLVVASEQALLQLSKQKWQWMADKDVGALDKLFDAKSVFVHMGGSWGKQQELDVIQSGGIHYKKADVHQATVQQIDNTAILLNRITLLAVVGGREVTNNFMVTEVYVRKGDGWKLASLSFTKLLE